VRRLPLHQDAQELCALLFEVMACARAPRLLAERIERGGMRLLDEIALATTGIDRLAAMHRADAELQTLRAQLEVGLHLDALRERDAFAVLDLADRIGRQLGGWLRRHAARSVTAAPADLADDS
jgi:hypothetical protein